LPEEHVEGASVSTAKSFFYFIKEARYNPLKILHGLSYAATVTYLRVLGLVLAVGGKKARNHVQQTYHGKIIRLGEARRIITINRPVEARNLEHILPFKHARDVVLRNPQNIVVYQCACRALKKESCKPSDVCLAVGEPFADLLRLFQPFRSRRITSEEALRILEEEDARGHVHSAWFKTAMLDRFYAICNCCRCCCRGMGATLSHQMRFIVPSGYVSEISDSCSGCGKCARYCQFKAIELVEDVGGSRKKIARIIYDRCYGCGICESKCKEECISLKLDGKKGLPLDIVDLAKS
jgi:Pyruvate/2-oxoacid:ferredoxin oxidoreductase delta subunit